MVFLMVLWGEFYYCPHCTDEKLRFRELELLPITAIKWWHHCPPDMLLPGLRGKEGDREVVEVEGLGRQT